MDFIVYVQRTIGTFVLTLALIFFAFVICSKKAKKYISHPGCYLGTYLFYFLIPYGQGHSFFVSLLRYICIINPEKLFQWNISSEVRNKPHQYFNLHVYPFFRRRNPVPPSEFHHVNSFKGLTTLSPFAALEGLEGTHEAGTF